MSSLKPKVDFDDPNDTRFHARGDLEEMSTEEIIRYVTKGGPPLAQMDDDEVACLLGVLNERAMAIHQVVGKLLMNWEHALARRAVEAHWREESKG